MPWKPDYLTVAQASAYLRIPGGDTVDDVELQVWVTTASRAIDDYCNRQFGQLAAPALRTYDDEPVYNPKLGLWVMEIDDLQDATGFLVNGVAYASSGATLLPRNAPADGLPWTRLGFATQPYGSYPGAPVTYGHTGRWGWSTQPTQVGAAMRLQINRWNFRRDSPAGIAGSPDSGSEMRLLNRLDPDVKTTLLGLRRRRKVA
jgi:hypothetical protein